MINLLPDQLRTNNRYALRNALLLRYSIVSAFTMASIGAITGISILGMQRSQNDLQQQINTQNKNLATYQPLEVQGKQLSDELSTINSLLSRQVAFSTLLPQIAKIMPPGSVLQSLDVSTSDLLPASALSGSAVSTSGTSTTGTNIQKPFVIEAAVVDPSIATTLLENIKATTSLFTDADIVSVSQSTAAANNIISGSSVDAHYPYQVTINAYLKKINPQQLNTGGGATK